MNIYGLAVFSKIWISLVSGFYQKNLTNIFPCIKKGKDWNKYQKWRVFTQKI